MASNIGAERGNPRPGDVEGGGAGSAEPLDVAGEAVVDADTGERVVGEGVAGCAGKSGGSGACAVAAGGCGA